MITIIFESHGTTYDNEANLSSGWYDVELSELGKQQAKELGERYKSDYFDAIWYQAKFPCLWFYLMLMEKCFESVKY